MKIFSWTFLLKVSKEKKRCYRRYLCGRLVTIMDSYLQQVSSQLSVWQKQMLRKPSFFNRPRSSVLKPTKARAIPCWTAPACPCIPPPWTRTRISNLFKLSEASKGRFTSMRWVSSKKYWSNFLPLTVKLPEPGRRITRAVEVFLRPVPKC